MVISTLGSETPARGMLGNTGNNNIGIGLTGDAQIGIGGLNSGHWKHRLRNSGNNNIGFFNSRWSPAFQPGDGDNGLRERRKYQHRFLNAYLNTGRSAKRKTSQSFDDETQTSK